MFKVEVDCQKMIPAYTVYICVFQVIGHQRISEQFIEAFNGRFVFFAPYQQYDPALVAIFMNSMHEFIQQMGTQDAGGPGKYVIKIDWLIVVVIRHGNSFTFSENKFPFPALLRRLVVDKRHRLVDERDRIGD